MARVLILGSKAGALVVFRGSLIGELVARGHEVIACAPGAAAATRDALALLGASYHDVPLQRAGLHPLRDLRSLLAMVRLFRRLRPDALLAYNIKPVVYGSLAARLAGVGNICSIITGLGYTFSTPGPRGRVLAFVARLLYRLALRFNRRVVFQNRDDLALFRSSRIITQPDKPVLVNGSGVELDAFSPAPLPETPTFLLMARMVRAKGVCEFVAAARKLRRDYPEAGFWLLGSLERGRDAVEARQLEAWEHEGVIRYLGHRVDVRPVLAAASVFVLPSTYREGVPRSALEALAMGRAVITTDTPGCRETVEGSLNGFLVPPGDVDALAGAMRAMLEAPETIARMGAASRRLAERRFDVRDVNATIIDAMELI